MKVFEPILLLFALCGLINGASLIKQSGNKRFVTLDDAGKVLMAYEVDLASESITFEIEAETTGYIGFGISPNGGMIGADIFIAGVLPDGSTYSSDRFGVGTSEPKVDNQSDWKLLEAKEFVGITTITYLKFSRLLDTCDAEDYPITDDTNRLIWAMGATDTIEYHTSSRRGSRSVNLLGAPTPDVDFSGTLKWEMTLDMQMPSIQTAYWCSFHKGPLLDKTHHIVSYDALLPDENALKHTHHFILYNCYENPSLSNKTTDEIFANITVDTGYYGDYCYRDIKEGDDTVSPNAYCREYLYVWAKGGKKLVFPENLGYPIGDDAKPGMQQYYMLEIHYDNPDEEAGVRFKSGVQFQYTPTKRAIEAGQIMIGHQTSQSLTVPPNTQDFIVVGHCAPTCTEKFPAEGITIFNSLLHSHISGRKLKLRHFRDGKELPWIDVDDHYDFDYQQNKHLTKEVKVLPGDHIIYECTYDSTWNNNTIVVGDLSTRDEMAEAFLWYYPKIDIGICASTYPLQQGLTDLGIKNYTIVPTGTGNSKIYIDEPAELVGDYIESISKNIDWSEDYRKDFQETRRYGNHESICQSYKSNDGIIYSANITYPPKGSYEEYLPEDVCSKRGPTPTTPAPGLAAIHKLSFVNLFATFFVLFSAFINMQ